MLLEAKSKSGKNLNLHINPASTPREFDFIEVHLYLTSRIDRGHPLIMGNIWIMSNESMLMPLIWIMFTRSFPYIFCICSLLSWPLTSYLQNQLRTLRSWFCQVSLNSIQRLQRSRKCLSQSKAGVTLKSDPVEKWLPGSIFNGLRVDFQR